MIILKENTKSICPVCFQEINAKVIAESNGVYLQKECQRHGAFNVLIEKDVELYKRIMNKKYLDERIRFAKLTLPITYRCNLRCPMCYEPDKGDKDPSLEKLITTIKEFKGDLVKITGGEPTLKEELPLLIKAVKEQRKECGLVTNGIKLADLDYVQMLKKAGLQTVALSFSSFNDDIYRKIRGQRLLKIKLKALKNLKKVKMDVILSTTLVKGINESELKRIYRYYLENLSFIKLLRIRSMSLIGRHIETEPLCLSEIIELLSKSSGFTEQELIESYFQGTRYCPSTCRFTINLPFYCPTSCRFEINLHNAFVMRMLRKQINQKRLCKIRTILEGMSLFGLKRTGRLKDVKIKIRVWPDKHRLDLGELQWCSTALTKDGSLRPFCYAIILDEKKCT